MARDFMIEKYLDYVNNYLTLDLFAEHNGLTKVQATEFIALANEIFNSDHPEA